MQKINNTHMPVKEGIRLWLAFTHTAAKCRIRGSEIRESIDTFHREIYSLLLAAGLSNSPVTYSLIYHS